MLLIRLDACLCVCALVNGTHPLAGACGAGRVVALPKGFIAGIGGVSDLATDDVLLTTTTGAVGEVAAGSGMTSARGSGGAAFFFTSNPTAKLKFALALTLMISALLSCSLVSRILRFEQVSTFIVAL
jgi:hypothetical protein